MEHAFKKIRTAGGALLLLFIIGFAADWKFGEVTDTLPARTDSYDWLYRKKMTAVKRVTWARHLFETGILSTNQYKTVGNKKIMFTDTGFYAPSFSMPRSRLLDVDLNKKVKVTIAGVFEGESKNSNQHCTGRCITTEKYHFSEFATYIGDESGNRQALRLLGTRDNIIRGNNRDTYKFTSLTVENTGKEIVVRDNSGFSLSFDLDFKYVTSGGKKEENRGGNYGQLNKNQKWFLVINCHVNTEGYCKLDIKDIRVTGPSQENSSATIPVTSKKMPPTVPVAEPKHTPASKNEAPPSPQTTEETLPRLATPPPQVSRVLSVEEPKIEHIGIELEAYDSAAGRAGDFVFTHAEIFHQKLWQDYGEYITETSDGKPKINPQPTYIVPLGTKVRALTSGTIVAVKQIYSGDYTIHIAKNTETPWRYELEHVIHPVVKVGDHVTAGQVIAEASPHNSQNNAGYGLFEIGILKGGNPPTHYCPYAYLDASVKDSYAQKILALYRSWEEYRGKSDIYNENDYRTPGCLVNDPLPD